MSILMKFNALVKSCLDELLAFKRNATASATASATAWLSQQFDVSNDFWRSIKGKMAKQTEQCMQSVIQKVSSGIGFSKAANEGRESFKNDCSKLLKDLGISIGTGLHAAFVFDEARCLLQCTNGWSDSASAPFIQLRRAFRGLLDLCGVFAVLTDTTSRLHDFQPPKVHDPSRRALSAAQDLYQPIYLLGYYRHIC